MKKIKILSLLHVWIKKVVHEHINIILNFQNMIMYIK
jgi:hypothetical protein